MADTRDPGIAGANPFETDPAVQGANSPGAVEVRPVKVDMGMGSSTTARAHPDHPAARSGGGGGAGTVLLSALLALACGAGGAWGYEQFLSHPSSSKPSEPPPAATDDSGVHKQLAGLEDRVKNLSERGTELTDQYKHLKARLESLPASTATTKLGELEGKVAQVDRLSRQVEALDNRVKPLVGRIDQVDRRMSQFDERLNDLGNQRTAANDRPSDRDRRVALARDDRPDAASEADRPAPREAAEAPTPASASAPNPAADPGDAALGDGEAMFRKGRYSDAYAAFRKQLISHPEDARVWYYAALSYGLATGEWDQMTKTMVQEGVAREKAGKPAKPQIDSTFAGLTQKTGKDWLAFYRRGAG